MFLPGLLANNEMAQRSNSALSKPVTGRGLSGCITNGEKSAAHSILAKSHCSNKAEYICADQPVTLTFRLRQGGGPYSGLFECKSVRSTRCCQG
jgi:hypothetical protein